jgi:hypothetical protein
MNRAEKDEQDEQDERFQVSLPETELISGCILYILAIPVKQIFVVLCGRVERR